MNGVLVAGLLVTVISLIGYGLGIVTVYPGRAFTVTGIMLGLTLLAIGRSEGVNET